MKGRDRAPSEAALAASALVLVLAACDRLPDGPPGEDEARATAPSASASAAPQALEDLAASFFAASTTYASRCLIFHDFAFPSYDLCAAIEHCDLGAKMNLDAPCGFTQAERAAVVSRRGELERASASFDGRVDGAFATYLRHAALFSRWVDETTDIGKCVDRSPYGASYCYERTRGTLSMYQDMARAYFAWRPRPDAFIVPEAHHSFASAPPYRKYPEEVRRRGLPWGHCPDGICILHADKMQPSETYY